MTREQCKAFFVDKLGITEPTDEQISAYLNSVNAETKKEKDRADKLKAQADEAEGYKKQLDDIASQNMTDIEKITAERDATLKTVKDLQAQLQDMNIRNGLAEQGIVGDSATKLIESLRSGSLDTALLGTIIADREKSAVADYQKKALDDTMSPDGKKGDDDGDGSEQNEIVANVVKSLSADSQTTSIIDSYK